MADIINICKAFMPRRGRKSTMLSSGKKDIVLKEGELFLEYSDTGISSGNCNIKIGDGTTTYENLPYALKSLEEATDLTVTFSDAKSTTASNAMTSATSGSTIGKLFGYIRKAIKLLDSSVTTLQSTVVDTSLNGTEISTASNFITLTATKPLHKMFTFNDTTGWCINSEIKTYHCSISYENSLDSGLEINGRGMLYSDIDSYIIEVNGTSIDTATMSIKKIAISDTINISI